MLQWLQQLPGAFRLELASMQLYDVSSRAAQACHRKGMLRSAMASWHTAAVKTTRGGRLLARVLWSLCAAALGPSLRHWHRQSVRGRCDAAASRMQELGCQIAKLHHSHMQFREKASQEIAFWQSRLADTIAGGELGGHIGSDLAETPATPCLSSLTAVAF